MMEIRNYSPDDFDQVVSLYQDSSSYGGNFDPDRDTADRLLKTAEQNNLLVATYDNIVVGTIMILENPHTMWLLRFAVNVEHEHADLAAQKLVERSDQIARDRGHSSSIVYTNPDDKPLNDRYVELDFNASGLYRCYWKDVS